MDFSIVTPTLNQGRFIEQTILSVLSQKNIDVQYIVVDGGSTDETAEILERYRDRIDTIVSEPDRGQADALRKGFALARGRFVGYLNSDDYLLPDALTTAKRIFESNKSLDLVYGDRIFVDENDRLDRYWRLPRHRDYFMLRWDFIPQEACFWRRAAMEEVGGIDTSCRFALDYDLLARMMVSGKKLQHTHRFFAVFREQAAAKTTSQLQEIGIPEMNRVRDKYKIEIDKSDYFLAMWFTLRLRLRSWFYLKHNREPKLFRRRSGAINE